MRALVIGGSGQIGGWLLRYLRERGHSCLGTFATVPGPGLVQLDAADLHAASALVHAQRPDVVFYPAGFTWVDGCERDPARALAANLHQPLNVARATAECGGRFVYFSTDYVFDGESGPYTEADATHPLSVYGSAKRQAEIALAEAIGDAVLTLRTAWVFGPERQGKNFAYQLLRTLRAGETLTCPSDQISSPTYGPDIAAAAVRLAESGQPGLIHVAGPEVMSRVKLACAIAEAFGLDSRRIVSKPTAELGQAAARPLNSGLLTPRLDALLPHAMRPLAQALGDFRSQLESHG